MESARPAGASLLARGLILVILLAVAVPRYPAGAQELTAATPHAHPAGSGDLGGMLGRLPNRPLAVDAMVTYADIAGQAAALGFSPPRGDDDKAGQDGWVRATRTLMLPSLASSWAFPEWREAFGFDLFQVEQAAEYIAPTFSVTVLRGTFAPATLRAAWARGGYQPIDLGPGEAYAVRADNAVDFADSGSRLAMAHLNVVAMAPDGTLVCGSTRDGVREALAAIGGQGPSLADRPDVAPLLRSAPARLVSALIVQGGMLHADPNPVDMMGPEEAMSALATRTAAEQLEARRLPPVVAALLGQTAGSFPGMPEASSATPAPDSAPPTARLEVVLALMNPDAVALAAAVIDERLATQAVPVDLGGSFAGRPWTEIFPERQVRAAPGAVQIELVPAPDTPLLILQDLLFRRTPGFLAWQWPS